VQILASAVQQSFTDGGQEWFLGIVDSAADFGSVTLTADSGESSPAFFYNLRRHPHRPGPGTHSPGTHHRAAAARRGTRLPGPVAARKPLPVCPRGCLISTVKVRVGPRI